MFYLELLDILQLLLLLPIQTLADQSPKRLIVTWFDDYDCKKLSGRFAPPESEQIDSCHQLADPVPHSFLVNENNGPCAVTFYGDPECTFNATKAPAEHPLGYCASSAQLFGFALKCGSSASISSGTTAASKATTSSSSSPAAGRSSRALSTTAKIAIGVALPLVFIIVVNIFVIRLRNSCTTRRKKRGFVEIEMDNKVETSTMPHPEGSTKTQEDNRSGDLKAFEWGFSKDYDSQSYTSKPKVLYLGASNPHSSRPSELDVLPRFTTGNTSTMPTELSDNPVHGEEKPPRLPQELMERPISGPGGYSRFPAGYAELPANDWQGQPLILSEAVQTPMSNAPGHSASSGGFTETPMISVRGQSDHVNGIAELSANK